MQRWAKNPREKPQEIVCVLAVSSPMCYCQSINNCTHIWIPFRVSWWDFWRGSWWDFPALNGFSLLIQSVLVTLLVKSLLQLVQERRKKCVKIPFWSVNFSEGAAKGLNLGNIEAYVKQVFYRDKNKNWPFLVKSSSPRTFLVLTCEMCGTQFWYN